jgi:hypothetical protein
VPAIEEEVSILCSFQAHARFTRLLFLYLSIETLVARSEIIEVYLFVFDELTCGTPLTENLGSFEKALCPLIVDFENSFHYGHTHCFLGP